MAGAGLNTYRFSLEWSRIEPEEGEFSRAALDHYRRIVDGCRERGPDPDRHARPLHDAALAACTTAAGPARRPATGSPASRSSRRRRSGDAEYVATINEPNLMAAQPVLGGMARRGEPIHGLPRPDQGVADALLGLHDRAREVFRGAGLRTGMTLIGRENIAEDGGEERMRAERAAFEDQFLAGRRRRRLARPAGLHLRAVRPRRARRPGARSCRPWRTAWSAGRRRSARRSSYAADGAARRTAAGHRERHRHGGRRGPDPVHRGRPARPVRTRSPAAPTSAATCTGACSTTSSGCSATGPPSAWCPSTGRPSSGRRSPASPGSARWPAATAWHDRPWRSTTCSGSWTCRRRCGC